MKYIAIDDLFEDAAKILVQEQSASTSLIQRRLKLGYNRAGRLMDELVNAGVVSGEQFDRTINFKTEKELCDFLEIGYVEKSANGTMGAEKIFKKYAKSPFTTGDKIFFSDDDMRNAMLEFGEQCRKDGFIDGCFAMGGVYELNKKGNSNDAFELYSDYATKNPLK